jgi:type I restriction enzyme M protein
MLHGIKHPRFFYMDTLSKSFEDQKSLDVVLMNPPFKGKMDESDINPTLPTKCKKTELLFLHLILRVLDMGGRCAVLESIWLQKSSLTAQYQFRLHRSDSAGLI